MELQRLINLLGTEQKDKTTGFIGMVSSIAFDAYGCIQVALTPKVGKDNKYPDGHWFDVNRLIDRKKRILPVSTFATYQLKRDDFNVDRGCAEKSLRRE